MYIYIYIYIYTYIYVCMYIYAHIYVCHIIFLFFYDPHVVHIYLHVYLLESVLYYRLSLLPFPLTLLFVHFLLFSFLSLSLSHSFSHSHSFSLFVSMYLLLSCRSSALHNLRRNESLRIAPYRSVYQIHATLVRSCKDWYSLQRTETTPNQTEQKRYRNACHEESSYSICRAGNAAIDRASTARVPYLIVATIMLTISSLSDCRKIRICREPFTLVPNRFSKIGYSTCIVTLVRK